MGRAFKLGNNISTDEIIAGRFFHLRSNLPELAKHLLEDVYPDIYAKLKPGDVLVAGKNFGLGSSREHAAQIIKLVGVKYILAQSFSRIFYRNVLNIGLLAIECDTDAIDDNDELEVDVEQGFVHNKTKNVLLKITPMPPEIKAFIKEGGIVNYIKKYGDLGADLTSEP